MNRDHKAWKVKQGKIVANIQSSNIMAAKRWNDRKGVESVFLISQFAHRHEIISIVWLKKSQKSMTYFHENYG